MGETNKAKNRREKEGWFERYAPKHLTGIDIGCGSDPLNKTFTQYDKCKNPDADAQDMQEYEDNQFRTVYASHILQYLDDPIIAVKNWHRICQPNGYLIICVPHRDLYEKKESLPSNWSHEHKHFFMPFFSNESTLSLFNVIATAIAEPNIISTRLLDYNYESNGQDHPLGEFSFEVIIKKK